ncbi:hypothetical protein [Thiogranum longum]|uniref:hypothetical protein n=1 Tax=Thiogranum longum TaxID=1537524 RepID=UPI001044F2E6|nr:hypothetical protein [Thiogranum longum]
MALAWNVIAQPLFWLTAFNNPEAGGWKMVLTGLFPFIGLLLAWVAAVKWLQWKRFGKAELTMDPFPASPGGDAGGTIELPLNYRPDETMDITICCIKVTIRHSSKGNTRHESVLWRERATVSPDAAVACAPGN